MKAAIIVVDMIKGNLPMDRDLGIVKESKKIIPYINQLLTEGRKRELPIVFACDSFLEGDSLFSGGMRPHALRGTSGVEVIDELPVRDGDIILEKRRMSAFFKTDLDMTFRTLGADTAVVTGIATFGCVLTTALDAVQNDFRAIILEDCCTAAPLELHEDIIRVYKKVPLYPLLRIMKLDEFLDELAKS